MGADFRTSSKGRYSLKVGGSISKIRVELEPVIQVWMLRKRKQTTIKRWISAASFMSLNCLPVWKILNCF